MKKALTEFEIGFWHPFGPHGGETAEEIIERKRSEIVKNGWTLWSFQFRHSLRSWYEEIMKYKPNGVLVFCSEGKGARDPSGERKLCEYYTPVNDNVPKSIPEGILVPHPMGQKTKGSAFIVKNIIYPIEYIPAPIVWLKNGEWQSTPIPTRPEYLIKPGAGKPMRMPRAVLELQYPYLAEVGIK